MSHPIADLLKRALLVGATEVRLVPGRRTIVVMAQGESEVKGDPQTPEKITGLLAPILTPADPATGLARRRIVLPASQPWHDFWTTATYPPGAEIDYQEGIEGAQFVIKNPNASTTCGCGSSFSV